MEQKDPVNPASSQPQNPGQQPSMSVQSPQGNDLISRASQEEAAPPHSNQTFTPGAQATPTSTEPVSNTKPKSKKGLVIALIVVLALLLVAGAAGYYYLYIYKPKMALVTYLNKVNDAKSAQYKATLDTKVDAGSSTQSASLSAATAKSILTNTSATIDGAYNLKEQGNPNLSANIALTNQLNGNEPVKGEVVIADQSAYFKFEKTPTILTTLGLALTRDWYKLDIASSLAQTKCLYSKNANVGIVNAFIPLDLPIKNAKKVGSETVDGKSVTHYSGEIDTAAIANAITNANKDLAAECKLTLKPQQFENNTITYDLYTSTDFDRIKVTRKNTKTSASQQISLDTTAYGKDTPIEVPSGATDIKSMLQKLLSSVAGATSSASSAVADSVNKQIVSVTAAYQSQLAGVITSDQIAQITKVYAEQFTAIVASLEGWKKNTTKYPNPAVDWLSSTAGTAAKGPFGTSAIKSNYTDPVTGKTYAYTMVTTSAMPSCKTSNATTTATMYYQSLTKTTFALRLCTQVGLPVDIKSQ